MFRKTIFWIHLGCGVVTSLVVLMMSVTGVLLTYERQMLAWADGALDAPPPAGAERLAAESLVTAVRLEHPDFEASSISYSADPDAPASVGAGRSGSIYVNAYTGEVLGAGAEGMRSFFRAVTGWHRWFNATGEARGPARAITGASNLIFLFLIVSGVYLWFPRILKWAAFKTRLWFNPQATGGKARDFNWHHVFGLWSAIPLAVVVATALVFSYGWANDLVYRSVGEQPPQGGRGGGGGGGGAQMGRAESGTTAAPLPIDALLARASTHLDEWERITVQLPDESASTLSFSIDQGNGGQPTRRHNLTLDRYTGEVTEWAPFSSQTPGRQARVYIRYLHTGEALGIVGQTVAGIVSLTSVIMVWTGLALAYRRLIQPLFSRR